MELGRIYPARLVAMIHNVWLPNATMFALLDDIGRILACLSDTGCVKTQQTRGG